MQKGAKEKPFFLKTGAKMFHTCKWKKQILKILKVTVKSLNQQNKLQENVYFCKMKAIRKTKTYFMRSFVILWLKIFAFFCEILDIFTVSRL